VYCENYFNPLQKVKITYFVYKEGNRLKKTERTKKEQTKGEDSKKRKRERINLGA
jgi:hypothetical protein